MSVGCKRLREEELTKLEQDYEKAEAEVKATIEAAAKIKLSINKKKAEVAAVKKAEAEAAAKAEAAAAANAEAEAAAKAVAKEEDEAAVERVLKATDDHAVLGVSPGAGESHLARAYRQLSLKIHPDKNSAAGAADAFNKLSESFKNLKEELKKLKELEERKAAIEAANKTPPDARNNNWTPEEENQLRERVREYTDAGKNVNWVHVARAFPNRTNGKCRSKWKRMEKMGKA